MRLPRRRLVTPLMRPHGRRNAGLWMFLNSGFGLWLLSAIFLYGTGAVYAVWHSHHEDEEAKRRLVERLDTEIAYRLSTILYDLRSAASLDRGLESIRASESEVLAFDDRWASQLAPVAPGMRNNYRQDIGDIRYEGSASHATRIGDVLQALHAWLPIARRLETDMKSRRDEIPRSSMLLLSTGNGRHPSLYPEYSSYTLEALFITLERQLSVEERTDVHKALRFLLAFQETTPESDARNIKQHLLVSRWRLGFRQYLECPDSDPVCVKRDNLFGYESISADPMSIIVSVGLAVVTGAPEMVTSLGADGRRRDDAAKSRALPRRRGSPSR